MKIKTEINIDSKRYPRALKTAKKLKEAATSLDLLGKDEVIFLGYLSSCVALEGFINYMLYIFAQEDGSNKINQRFNRLQDSIGSINYDTYHVKEDRLKFLSDKQEVENLLSDFQKKYFITKGGTTLYSKRNDVIHGNLNAVRFEQEVNSEQEHQDLLSQKSTPEKINEFYNYGLSEEIFIEMFDDCNDLVSQVHAFFRKYIDYAMIQLAQAVDPIKYSNDQLGRMNALDHFTRFDYDYEFVSWSACATVIK